MSPVKNIFITIICYKIACIHTIGDFIIPLHHSINIALEFIHITIETARYNVVGCIS